MHRLRCIITADFQLLFNQMYVKAAPSPSLLSSTVKKKKKAERRIKVDLSYAALWWMKAKVSQQINGIQQPLLPLRSASSLDSPLRPGCWAAVSIIVPQWFDAPIQPRLMSGLPPACLCDVPSASERPRPTDSTGIYLIWSILSIMHQFSIPALAF